MIIFLDEFLVEKLRRYLLGQLLAVFQRSLDLVIECVHDKLAIIRSLTQKALLLLINIFIVRHNILDWI